MSLKPMSCVNAPSKFPKFATNLPISLICSCQSNHELRNKVAKFVASEVRVTQCSWFGNISTNKFKQSENISQPTRLIL